MIERFRDCFFEKRRGSKVLDLFLSVCQVRRKVQLVGGRTFERSKSRFLFFKDLLFAFFFSFFSSSSFSLLFELSAANSLLLHVFVKFQFTRIRTKENSILVMIAREGHQTNLQSNIFFFCGRKEQLCEKVFYLPLLFERTEFLLDRICIRVLTHQSDNCLNCIQLKELCKLGHKFSYNMDVSNLHHHHQQQQQQDVLSPSSSSSGSSSSSASSSSSSSTSSSSSSTPSLSIPSTPHESKSKSEDANVITNPTTSFGSF